MYISATVREASPDQIQHESCLDERSDMEHLGEIELVDCCIFFKLVDQKILLKSSSSFKQFGYTVASVISVDLQESDYASVRVWFPKTKHALFAFEQNTVKKKKIICHSYENLSTTDGKDISGFER